MSSKGHCLFGQRKVVRYLVALLATAAAVAIRALIDPWVGNKLPFAPIFLAVIFVGWTCGTGPGLATFLLGFVVMDFLFVQPRHSFAIVTAGDVGEVVTLFLMALGTLWLIRLQRTTHQRAVEGERLARNHLVELETIYQQAPIGLCFIDLQGHYVRINEQLAAMNGHSPAEHLGRTVWEMVPELEPILRPAYHQVITTSQPVHNLEFRARLASNPHEQWRLGSYYPVKDSDGRVIGINITILDITDRKQAEERLQQLNLHLEQHVRERTAELESFTYSVAHDLRAPVRSICSFTELVLQDSDGEISPANRELLQTVISSAERMDHLILDLLTLSNLSQRELRQKTVNLSSLAESIAAQFRKANPRRADRVHFEIAPDLLVRGDERSLRLALENLFDNAWKFTSTHSSCHIEFGVQHQDGEAVYFVRDDGVGFDMTHANRLFGIFERLHNPSEFPGVATGTGIGLALVERIITRHEGRIWADSAPGRGATFYFTLPPGETPRSVGRLSPTAHPVADINAFLPG